MKQPNDSVLPGVGRVRRIPADVWLILAACVGAWGLFVSLGRLWPLVPGDLHVPPARLRALSARFLATQGVSVAGYEYATEFAVDDDLALDDATHRFGQAQTRRWINADIPLSRYVVVFRRGGDPNTVYVDLSATTGRPLSWRRETQEDDPVAAPVAPNEARRRAAAALDTLAPDALAPAGDFASQATFAPWRAVGVSDRQIRGSRVDRLLTFERYLSQTPELRERALVRFAGGSIVGVTRVLLPAPAALRDTRRRDAPREALLTVGEILFGLAVVGAFLVFLLRLRAGEVRLRPAATVSGAVFVCTLAAALLQGAGLFAEWDTLWPRPVSLLRSVVMLAQSNLWTIVVLLAVVAAGDTLDRDGANRGATFWKLARGGIFDRNVGASSGRGFLLGLIAGGVMAGAVWCLARFAHAEIALQPQGFFLAVLNSSAPALGSLLYFLHVALLEEMGYRFFAGTWLLRYTRRPVLAVVLPALVYGLTHTTLLFLPPAEPFWGRALVMTLVGCVWGWAFLRYDALTVVTSHLTCDLFIFNWPRLASGDPWLIASAALTVLVPLLPALGLLGRVTVSRPQESPPPPA